MIHRGIVQASFTFWKRPCSFQIPLHRVRPSKVTTYALKLQVPHGVQQRLVGSQDSAPFKMSGEPNVSTRPEGEIEGETTDTSKRPFDASTQTSSKETHQKRTKLSKKEAAKNHTRRSGYDAERNDREIPKHGGSYAHPAQQELFGLKDIDDQKVVFPESQKMVKRKVALFLGFLGTNYVGFQVNVGQRTLQAEIELALYRSGMLTKMNFGNPHKYSWSSSARTDKGVHACAQVCSLKVELLESDIEDGLQAARERLQGHLPPEIQALDLLRTTRNFCAKTQRDRVRYQYMVPSFLLLSDYRQVLADAGIPLEGRNDKAKSPLSQDEVKSLQANLNSYRSTTEQREALQNALKQYEGTKPFHNFTKGLKPGQPQAFRFIEYFRVQEPIVVHGVEWIPTQVLGQSFLLHQIRKMISLAVEVARGAASMSFMTKALRKQEVVTVPLAPPHGLFLEMSYYGGYNRRKGSQNPDLPDIDFLEDGPGRDRWESFRTTIRDHVVEEEAKEGNFLQYVYQQECIFDHKRLYNPADSPESVKDS